MHVNDNTSQSMFEGGAITALQSEISINGRCSLVGNAAITGGAILATNSKIYVPALSSKYYHRLTPTLLVSNNSANDSGGGLYLFQSELNLLGLSIIEISGNTAQNEGGGIYAISSNIFVFRKDITLNPINLQVSNNKAVRGGGIYMGVNAKIFVLEYTLWKAVGFRRDPVMFEKNFADYGGAMYVADEMNFACESTSPYEYSVKTECFMQSLMFYRTDHQTNDHVDVTAAVFRGNVADVSGSDLYGGLLDRCTVSPFAEVYYAYDGKSMTGLAYFTNISVPYAYFHHLNITSDSVQVCFCKHGKPDCDHNFLQIEVPKGGLFSLELLAVDQVRNIKLSTVCSVREKAC